MSLILVNTIGLSISPIASMFAPRAIRIKLSGLVKAMFTPASIVKVGPLTSITPPFDVSTSAPMNSSPSKMCAPPSGKAGIKKEAVMSFALLAKAWL